MKLQNIPAVQGISILYGHRIMPAIPQGISPYADTTITVNALKSFLKRHEEWQKISLKQCMNGDFNPNKPALVMTFDDGYQDIIDHGLQIFESFDCPITVFLSSGFCLGKQEPLENIFAARLQQSTMANKIDIYENNRGLLKKGSYKKRTNRLETLSKKYGLDKNILPHTEFLNSTDILKLAKHPLVTLGLHGKTHPLMTHITPVCLWDELTKPKRILESLIWQELAYFSYPYGGHNMMTRIFTRMAKYKAGFTTGDQLFIPTKTPRFAVPRIALRDH